MESGKRQRGRWKGKEISWIYWERKLWGLEAELLRRWDKSIEPRGYGRLLWVDKKSKLSLLVIEVYVKDEAALSGISHLILVVTNLFLHSSHFELYLNAQLASFQFQFVYFCWSKEKSCLCVREQLYNGLRISCHVLAISDKGWAEPLRDGTTKGKREADRRSKIMPKRQMKGRHQKLRACKGKEERKHMNVFVFSCNH